MNRHIDWNRVWGAVGWLMITGYAIFIMAWINW